MYAAGDNCPIMQLITKREQCLNALSSLGLKPIKMNVDSPTKPAGCYFLKEWGYFNNIANPESTEPEKFDGRGGVCKMSGIRAR